MAIPKVAIVGRPNVGKSSLFNWLAGRRIAIVDPTPGVTRDRLTTLIELDDRYFELVDTGGMGVEDVDNLTEDIERQIALAIHQAEAILFVVDARAGVAPLDQEVSERLRAVEKPTLCVVNKCDVPENDVLAADFHVLGYEPLLTVSAKQKRGKAELLEWIGEHLPPAEEDQPEEAALKLAIVGRRNTGKSTFINCLAKDERVIVSEVPGTTRDSVDIHFEKDGKVIIAIDTAGVRKKKSVGTDVEWYGMARAERSIRRADVVLLFHDAAAKVSQVDKQLAHYVLEQHKPAIFVVNKWDLLKDDVATGEFGEYLLKTFPSLDYVPIVFITAKDGKNVQKVLDLAQNLYKQASRRVSTPDLNRLVRAALDHHPPPLRQNRRPKVYFATQADVRPPSIVLITNGPQLFDNTYRSYLMKVFRDQLPFKEVPIRLYLRSRNREEKEKEIKEEQQFSEQERNQKSGKAKRSKKADRGKPRGPELWQD